MRFFFGGSNHLRDIHFLVFTVTEFLDKHCTHRHFPLFNTVYEQSAHVLVFQMWFCAALATQQKTSSPPPHWKTTKRSNCGGATSSDGWWTPPHLIFTWPPHPWLTHFTPHQHSHYSLHQLGNHRTIHTAEKDEPGRPSSSQASWKKSCFCKDLQV